MKIIIIAGSNRKESSGTKLCKYIAKQLEGLGCQVTLFILFEKPLPFYGAAPQGSEGDHLLELKSTAKAADGIVLCTPDYHGGISGTLKNALDHLGFDHFDSKPVLSVSSSGGAVGVSPLQQLQVTVRNIHGINSPEWISIGGDQRGFDENGAPLNAAVRERTLRAVHYFLKLAETLSALPGVK